MEASKYKDAKKKKLRGTTILDNEEVPEDQVVDMEDEKDQSETEFDEDLVSLKLHIEITKSSSQGLETSKDPKTQKKDVGKFKRGDPAPTWGPDSHVKRQRVEKIMTKE